MLLNSSFLPFRRKTVKRQPSCEYSGGSSHANTDRGASNRSFKVPLPQKREEGHALPRWMIRLHMQKSLSAYQVSGEISNSLECVSGY